MPVSGLWLFARPPMLVAARASLADGAQAIPAAAMANLCGVRGQANDATQTASYGGVRRRGGRVPSSAG
jgi:hypothetical protein